MTRKQIWHRIEIELRRDKKINAAYPDHVVAQSAMVSRAAGMLTASSIDFKYNPDEQANIRVIQQNLLYADAVLVAVASIRFLENLIDEQKPKKRRKASKKAIPAVEAPGSVQEDEPTNEQHAAS